MNDNYELSDSERQKPTTRLTPEPSVFKIVLWVVMISGTAVFISFLAYSLGSGQSIPVWLPWVGIAAFVAAVALYLDKRR